LLEKGQPDTALDYFSKALNANPNDASATFGVGQVYDTKGKGSIAADHYYRALDLEKNPDRKSRILNFIDKVGGFQA